MLRGAAVSCCVRFCAIQLKALVNALCIHPSGPYHSVQWSPSMKHGKGG